MQFSPSPVSVHTLAPIYKHIVSKGFITSDASHTGGGGAGGAAAVVSPTTEWRISKQFIAITDSMCRTAAPGYPHRPPRL